MTVPLKPDPDEPPGDSAMPTEPKQSPSPPPEPVQASGPDATSEPTPPTVSVRQTVEQIEAGATVVGVQVGYTVDEVRGLLEAAIIAARRDQAPLAIPATIDELDAHYRTVVKALVDGRLVPFLGTEVNLCARPEGANWRTDHCLPSGPELAEYLAESFGYPAPNRQDLVRVAQYVAVVNGVGPLYDNLRTLFDADYSPTPLHQLLALVPELLRAKGYPRSHQLIITTNYDDLLERTFESAGEPFDVVTYVAEDVAHSGQFVHKPYGSEPRVITEKVNEYQGLPIEGLGDLTRSIILKLHGAVDRSGAQQDSFVITEDHYIDYLARQGAAAIPPNLVSKLIRTNFLFLGCSLRDWHLRVILHRIWGGQRLSYASWAVQATTDALDQKFWRSRDVEFTSVRLEDYVAQLTTRLSALPLRT